MGTEQAASKTPVLTTLLVSDLIDSMQLVEELGDQAAAELGHRHDRQARDLLAAHEGREIDKTDGFLLLFDRPLAAVSYALEYHATLRQLSDEEGRSIEARVGIHFGEVLLNENAPDDVARGAKPLEVEGLAKPMTGRLMSLARGGQTLLTRGAFDLARRGAAGVLDDQELSWLAHGGYLFKGAAMPVEVFEVGRERVAPLEAPEDSAKARRVVEQTTIPGWRPVTGLAIPHRGHWVVEEKLGEGGFGEAWLTAHKKTRERRVFKFCYDPASLKTLQREITLFRLLKEELGDRDDISRIVDWNFDQAPYFIESEYTEGGDLVDWAEDQGGLAQVPLTVRLEIVAQVATALSAAHSVGVLHKDIKPSNVLIAAGPEGEPQARLSDFGVGAVTEAKRLADAGITVLGMTARTEVSTTSPPPYSGTRLYTAPEVLEGKPATLQADVYALGLMLYQLVVGDLYRALAPGWRRDVADKLLAEDIAVAVDGSPERRLGNALRLAERLRALDSRRQERAAEQRRSEEEAKLRATLEKAKKRRRIWTVAVLALVLFVGALTLMVFRVRSEAERALRETERAEKAAVFLAELFEITNPSGTSDPGVARGTTLTVRELIDHGRDKLESSFEDDPRTRGRLMATLGEIYQGLGHYQQAEPLLEEALALRRQAHGEDHPDIATSLDLLAWLLQNRGEYEGAEPLYRESLKMRRRLLGDEHPEVAEALNNLALVLQDMGDYQAAEPLYRESLEMNRRLLGNEHPGVASNLNNLARLLQDMGDYQGAEPLFRESVQMHRQLLGDEHPHTATSLDNLADLLTDKGDYEGAEPLFRQALEMKRRLLGDEHPSIANSLYFLASLLRAKGDYEEAEVLSRQSLAMDRRLLGDEHPNVAFSLNNLALVLRAKGDYEGTEPLLRESLTMRRRLLGDEHPDVATSLKDLAVLWVARNQPATAKPLIDEALMIYRKALPANHWRIANAEGVLGSIQTAMGRYEEAEPLLVASYPIIRDQKGERSDDARDARERLVVLYEAWDKPEKAAEYRALWVEAGGSP